MKAVALLTNVLSWSKTQATIELLMIKITDDKNCFIIFVPGIRS